jgi:hypothetical protein
VTGDEAQERRDADIRMCDMRHGALGDQLDTLGEHITALFVELEKRMDQRFVAQELATTTALAAAEKAVSAAMTAAEKAVLKAELLATQRAEQQNEWRQTVTDLTSTMMPRKEYEAAHINLVTQMAEVTSRVDTGAGRGAGMGSLVGWIFAGAMTLIALITIILEISATR